MRYIFPLETDTKWYDDFTGGIMKESYKNMRAFWTDVTNLENRKGVLEIGPDHISVAGVEMAFNDGKETKHLFLATNSLGDSSLYFENNSKSGIGGMIGGHGNEALQTAAAHMLGHASRLTRQMERVPAGTLLPAPTGAGYVRLFAVNKESIFHTELKEEQARDPQNPFYPFFAYSQQTLGLFRTQQDTTENKAHA